jgi:cell division septal protein FtsQ
MLDDDERTVLEETERALIRDDPSLVRRMRRGASRRGRAARLRFAVVLVTVALVVGLFWLSLPGQALLVVMVGAGFLVGLGWRPKLDRLTTSLRPPRQDP